MYADKLHKPKPSQAWLIPQLQAAPAAPDRLAAMLNGSPRVQSQLRLGQALNQSPRAGAPAATVQRKVVTVQSHGPHDLVADDIQFETLKNLRNSTGHGVVDTLVKSNEIFDATKLPLEDMAENETLYVLGHGTGDTINGKTAPQLLALLEEFGYSNKHKGLIDLVSCQSAQYIAGLAKVMKDGGYSNDIKGYHGLVHVNAKGGFEVLPDSSAKDFLLLKQKAKDVFDKEMLQLDAEQQKSADPGIERRRMRLKNHYNMLVASLDRMFQPAALHEAFNSEEAWKRHGTPRTIEEWIEQLSPSKPVKQPNPHTRSGFK